MVGRLFPYVTPKTESYERPRLTNALTVDEHIPRRCGERRSHTVERARELDLTAETRRVREAKGHVQHIVLVVLRGAMELVREINL